MEFLKCRDVRWKGPKKRNKPDVLAPTAKHPDERSQISRYGWMQPTYMRSVSFWGKFTSGSRISASRSDLLKVPIRDLQIRLRLRVRVRLLSARDLGLSCRRHCCCRRQLATKIFQSFLRVWSYNICQSRECLVDKQHKMPQSCQNIARQVARNISQCIRAFKD